MRQPRKWPTTPKRGHAGRRSGTFTSKDLHLWHPACGSRIVTHAARAYRRKVHWNSSEVTADGARSRPITGHGGGMANGGSSYLHPRAHTHARSHTHTHTMCMRPYINYIYVLLMEYAIKNNDQNISCALATREIPIITEIRILYN